MTPEEEFREKVRELLIDWYEGCPRPMKFTNSVIKEYKRIFPDDKFLSEVGKGK